MAQQISLALSNLFTGFSTQPLFHRPHLTATIHPHHFFYCHTFRSFTVVAIGILFSISRVPPRNGSKFQIPRF
ncbi:MAG: hypothetical protein OEL83_08885 [Desulforhopalus sp.]|nr:hypothetical protein [Desulforhopalus sp.]